MSASQIPNLNTLRRGGGRGRLRGRGGLAGDGSSSSSTASRGGKDRVVQGTDHDASVSRLSAVGLGYLEDPFARALTPPDLETRRLPIINRGLTHPPNHSLYSPTNAINTPSKQAHTSAPPQSTNSSTDSSPKNQPLLLSAKMAKNKSSRLEPALIRESSASCPRTRGIWSITSSTSPSTQPPRFSRFERRRFSSVHWG